MLAFLEEIKQQNEENASNHNLYEDYGKLSEYTKVIQNISQSINELAQNKKFADIKKLDSDYIKYNELFQTI